MIISRSTIGAPTGGHASDFCRTVWTHGARDVCERRRSRADDAARIDAGVPEAERQRLVELLHAVDTHAYTALRAERGLLRLLGSRAIELAPQAADEMLRSRSMPRVVEAL